MFKVGLYFFYIFNKFVAVNHLAFGKIYVSSNFMGIVNMALLRSQIQSWSLWGGDEA